LWMGVGRQLAPRRINSPTTGSKIKRQAKAIL